MILVAGSANLDYVVRASHIPAPGETVLGHDASTFAGGKGANQAVASARAGGAATRMLLALGADSHAIPIEASLRSAGVHMHIVRVAQAPTGTAYICVDDRGENAITVAPGANLHLGANDLPDLHGISHLLLQLETPIATVVAYAQAAQAGGVCVVLNAAPARALPAELLRHVDVLIVNEEELTALAPAPGTLAQRLRDIAIPTVIVTLGARGCCARQQERFLLTPSFTVTPVDTTGAGDTFCGSLCAQLSQGQALPEALRYASAAAALACTQRGAQNSIPARADVDRFLQHAPPPGAEPFAALTSYCGLPDTNGH